MHIKSLVFESQLCKASYNNMLPCSSVFITFPVEYQFVSAVAVECSITQHHNLTYPSILITGSFTFTKQLLSPLGLHCTWRITPQSSMQINIWTLYLASLDSQTHVSLSASITLYFHKSLSPLAQASACSSSLTCDVPERQRVMWLCPKALWEKLLKMTSFLRFLTNVQ